MAAGPPTLSLYAEGLQLFRSDFKKNHPDSKYESQLHEYLKARNSADDARRSCESLSTETEKKYSGVIKVGDTEILTKKWISRIMSNIGNFILVGNVAMTGAPESVGLAWFAITKALGAIQSNFQLYALFGSGLTDITELMITIQHFDNLYDERTKAEFEASGIVKSLFGHIRSVYAAILDFGFSVHRHISGGKLAQYRHAFKDIFGSEVGKFQGKIDLIVDLKRKVLEASDGAFQAKSFQHLENIQDNIKGIQAHFSDIKRFQETSTEFFQAQRIWQDKLLESVEDLKASSRPKSPWEIAISDFNKIKDLLLPLRNVSGPLKEALDSKHEGTCQWIHEHTKYTQWLSSGKSGALCLTGQPGSGKSTLLASIFQKIDDDTDDEKVIVQYVSCDMTSAESGDKSPQSFARITSTLVYQLYERATLNENNSELLEACNKIFSNPKQDRAAQSGHASKKNPDLQDKTPKLITAGRRDVDLPDCVDALRQLSMHLKADVVIAVDAMDRMSSQDQTAFAESLAQLENEESQTCVRIIVASRTNPFASSENVIDVGKYNYEDIGAKLQADLQGIKSLSKQEVAEAKEKIGSEAGSDFRYVVQVAVPFMQEPFQRPLSERLNVLPKGISDAYKQFLQGLSGNYLQLLRTALQWTLFASSPVRVIEIMDAFTGVYRLSGQSLQDIDAAEVETTRAVRSADRLAEVQQLRTAGGPFLDIWDEEGDWWVSLADVSQARQFCISHDQPDDDDRNHQVRDGPVCIKCDIPLDRSKALVFSERELHLEMAISSLRHLNNPIFQMQSGELPDWIEELLNIEEVPQTQDESLPVGPNEAADSSETEANTAIEPLTVTEVSDKVCENRPSTNAQLNTVEAEGSTDSLDNTNNKTDGPDSTANDGSMPATENMAFPDCSASDESADDEDRQIFDSAAEAQELAGENQDVIDYWRRRTAERFRYEVNFWYYHLRRAEELYLQDEISSSPAWGELKRELDRFVQNDDFFKRWQWMLFLREIETEYFTDLPWKPLHLASFLGLTSWAQHLIAGGHSLTERSGGVTPLLAAGLKADNLDILELLLEHGADPNDTDDRVGTPCLHRWLRHDQSYKAMKLFIDHGADPTKENPNRGIAMHYLAAYAHDDPEASDVLKLLITSQNRSKEEIINAPDEWKMTPLHHLLGRREVPKELLKDFILQGADVNLDDDTSLRPLQNACYWGDIDVVQILLPSVTHVDDPDNHGRTALHEAAWAGHRALVEILINDKGADANVKDFHGRTPLFFACLSDPSGRVGDSRGTIKFLVETLHQKGLSFHDINSATKRNRTPLRQAAARGFSDVVEDLLHMLRNSGADAAAVLNGADTRKGRTALHCAAARGHQECVRLLLEFGADVRTQDKSEKTALQLCYEQWALTNRQEFEDTALLLCDKDPSAAVGDAELPAIAATNNSRKLLKRLAGINVDLARPDQYGWTPLALARRSRSSEAKGYLEEYFARDAQLPSRWLDPGDVASLSESGLDITYIGRYTKAVLTSDKPLPAHLTEFYFEIRSIPAPEIKDDPEDFPIMAIGFCTLGAAGLEFPGWPPLKRDFSTRSWAYHGDDGGYFDGISPRGMDHGPRYRAGDTVGCGIDLEEGRMWFTLNGKRLDKEFLGVGGRLFPVVGLDGTVVLETMFAKPFFTEDAGVSPGGDAKVAGTTETTPENAHDKGLEDGSAQEEIARQELAEQTNVGEVQASSGAEQ